MSIPSGMGHSGIVAIPIPPQGDPGEALSKQSSADYDFDWDPVVLQACLDSLSYFLGE